MSADAARHPQAPDRSDPDRSDPGRADLEKANPEKADREKTGRTELEPAGVPEVEFARLFTQFQRRLYLYILAQVTNAIDAEEILQETNVIAWTKFRQFQSGTNFLAWASQIATFEIMKYRSKRRRERLQFSEEFLKAVAQESLDRADELERRRAALVVCLQKLRPRDRELIQQRYAPGESGKGLAGTLGRPANSVYQSLGRIRRSLQECIQRQLATGT